LLLPAGGYLMNSYLRLSKSAQSHNRWSLLLKKFYRWTFFSLVRISVLSAFLVCLAASCALEPEEFTITFNPDKQLGGTGTMEPVSAKAGEEIELPRNSFTNEAGDFKGWLGITPEGAIIEFADKDVLEMPEYDLELFACWPPLPQGSNPTYTVGGLGPSGGYIFFNKGKFVDGWQYMEAAPADVKIEVASGEVLVEDPYGFSWGEFPRFYKDENGKNIYITTSYRFGKGKDNTASILTVGKGKDSAAKRCDDLIVNNGGQVFDDWFLPSSYELSQMYNVLHRNNKGAFSNYVYWTSTEKYNSDQVEISTFDSDYHGPDFADRGARFRVRPVRMF
jgi:hypothetical protein